MQSANGRAESSDRPRKPTLRQAPGTGPARHGYAARVFESLLIANRAEIASRVIRTANRMGIRTIAVHSEADEQLPFVAQAHESTCIGPPSPAASYLDAEAVLAAAERTGARAVHPGYGFLSESAAFAESVMAAGMTWVGPSPAAITAMGDKIKARNLMEAAGVPVMPGTADPVREPAEAVAWAEKIGYPVMVKAAGGGGGIGMAPAADEAGLLAAFDSARSRAQRFFGHADILLERYVPSARHIEVQILGLADGQVIAVGERDCSVQRRHQKVAEEAPPPRLTVAQREHLRATAVLAGNAVHYRGAGTVEMLFDNQSGQAWFLEMNTRLQVEHPVTEMTTGIDLVEQQLLIAAGEEPSFDWRDLVPVTGHALELRIYAEDPKRFLPGPGTITEWVEPSGVGVRVDSGYRVGNTVTQFYDPLMAKLIVHGATRDEALDRARRAVSEFVIVGPKNNLPFFVELLDQPDFVAGCYDTGLVDLMRARPVTIG